MLEQGSFQGGSFNLSLFSFAASGSYSFYQGQSDSSSWSGGYSGSGNNSSSEYGGGSWTLLMEGSYTGGQWNLTTDVLQGSSSGNYLNNAGSNETLGEGGFTTPDGLGGSFHCSGGGTVNTNYNYYGSGGETESLYQSGQVSAGVYSNNSYNEGRDETALMSTSSSDPTYDAGDTWQDGVTLTLTGSGSSGTVTGSSQATYSWNNSGNDSGGGTSSWQTASPGTLPQGFVVPPPLGTSVPQSGAEQSSSSPDLTLLLTTTSVWMWSQGQYAGEATDNGAAIALDEVPPGGASAVGAGNSGVTNLPFMPGQNSSSPSVLPSNPATDAPTQQLFSAPSSSAWPGALMTTGGFAWSDLVSRPGQDTVTVTPLPYNPATDCPTQQLFSAPSSSALPADLIPSSGFTSSDLVSK